MKKYCHLCGSKYIENKTQPQVCSGCKNKSYNNASPTVDILLFDEQGRALIAERGIEPAKGRYDLPGGFVDYGETFEEALAREVKEELNLTLDDFSNPVFVQSQVADYTFSKETKQVLGCTFAAKLLTAKSITPHDDVASVRFVSLDELDSIKWSLKTWPKIIRKAHKQLFG